MRSASMTPSFWTNWNEEFRTSAPNWAGAKGHDAAIFRPFAMPFLSVFFPDESLRGLMRVANDTVRSAQDSQMEPPLWRMPAAADALVTGVLWNRRCGCVLHAQLPFA